ncbi:MAG: extensin-like domain-containing protein [Sulfitobacter sp.]
MRRGAIITAALLALGAGAALAGPETSQRPVARKAAIVVMPEAAPSGTIIRPVRDHQNDEAAAGGKGLGLSLRPFLRSRKAEKTAVAQRRIRQKGAVCGDLAIQGEAIGRVPGKISGCGVEGAVRVRSVSGISLSQTAVMDCGTAKALKSWLDRSAKPALARKGGGLKQLKVAAHYACRRRNNAKTGKISEHGKGRAIDLSGFVLQDGTKVSVLKGWHSRSYRKPLKAMHQGACGPFGTVLGPNANRFHLDHFHFDTARYRSGSYCR